MVHELLPRIFIRSQNEHRVYIFTHVKAIHCSHEGHFVVQKEKERFAVIEINNLVKNTGIIRLSIICHSLWNRGKFMVFWVQTVLANQQR